MIEYITLRTINFHNTGRFNTVVDALDERIYQDGKWGGPENDDNQTEDDWQKYITEYCNAQGRASTYDFRKRMVKVAALALAALESYDRKCPVSNN